MKRCILAIFLSISLTCTVSAAKKLPFDLFYDLVLLYLETSDDSSENPEELHANLSKYYENPIEWNNATHQQLADLLFIPDQIIDELLYYVYVYGPVHSINELRLVPYVDDKLFDLLPSVLAVSDSIKSPNWVDPFSYASHKFTLRSDFEAERRKGYKSGTYPDPPFRQLVKYSTEASPSFSAAVTLETDAGEPWNVRGFDLYRAYAQFSSFLNDSRVVVGSYRASFGCGLVLGTYSYGNFSSRLRSKRSSYAIRGYSGTSEAPSLNGVAASIVPVKGLSISAIYGYSPIDAHITGGFWSSVIDDGLHRTISEQANNFSLNLHTIAAHILYSHRFFSVGATAYGGFFSLPSTVFGNRQWALSLDYSAKYRVFSFSGETSISQGNGIATTNFITVTPLPELSFALNIRHFSNDYHSFWANSYARYDRVSGEDGVSFSAIFPLYRFMTIDFFADVTRNNIAVNTSLRNPLFYDFRARYSASFRNSSTLHLYFRFKQQQSTYLPLYNHIYNVSEEQVYLLNLNYRCPFPNGFTTNSGAQFSLAREFKDVWSSNNLGWLIYQDVDYSLAKTNLLFRIRLALFDAPLWANRFYLNEASIAESSYSPVLYGEGFRWYFIMKYNARCGLSAQLRIAQTIYADRQEIGSSHDLTSSPHRTEFSILLSYRFKQNKNTLYYERRPTSL
ncbi:MAG: hypothetical protein MJ002_09130 [Paludibacteraceae bacterium]|nr:hypothetical protein [Paludibacteraceae bacterium]